MKTLINEVGRRCIDDGTFRSMAAPFLPVPERLVVLDKLCTPIGDLARACKINQAIHQDAQPGSGTIDVYLARRALAQTIVTAIKSSFALGTAAYLETDIQDLLNK